MTYEEILSYCLAKPGAWQDEPWEGRVVAKVADTIFVFLGSGSPSAISVKCGPNRVAADEWIARYPEDASPSPYIGRFGWNSLRFDGAIPDEDIREAIDTSYDTVVATLPKKRRPATQT